MTSWETTLRRRRICPKGKPLGRRGRHFLFNMSITIYVGKTSRHLVLKYLLCKDGEEFFKYRSFGSDVRKTLIHTRR